MRIGFFITGFTTSPPDRLPFVLPGVFTSPGIPLTPEEGFALIWRVKSLQLDYTLAIDDGTGPVLRSNSLISANFPNPVTSEQEIGCRGFLNQKFTFAPDGVDTSTILNSYDSGTGNFFLYCPIQIASLSNDPSTGPGCAVFLNVFGHSMPFYMPGGFVSASGTVDVGVHEFWEYRDAAGNNPIWDAATGAQLISPVPVGVE